MKRTVDFLSRFGFNGTPFTCEIRVNQRFTHDIFETPLKYLQATVDKRMCAVLIAPAGTGKTFLLRALIDRLPEARYSVHYVKVTDLGKRDMCREIAIAAGAEPAGTYPALVRRLQDRLAGCLDIDGRRPVLVLDEAHDMRPDVLGILRILTNFEMDSRLVVSIILAGQAPLGTMLCHPKIEDVTRRLGHYATLRPFSRDELKQYIVHRCAIAGANLPPFDNDSLEAIYEIGRGNPRSSDHLALKALEVAHENDCDIVCGRHIVEARRLLWP